VLAVLVGLAHVPWRTLTRHAASISEVRVEGLRYLDVARVEKSSGLTIVMDWLGVDLRRARQELLRDSRIRNARVERTFPHGIKIVVDERMPVLLVRHGSPWELDQDGVLLEPLGAGVVADVPMLTGVDADRMPAGVCVSTPSVRRGIAWARATAAPELELAGRISEIDVTAPETTGLLLMNGTRVLSSAWPPSVRRLSALRVVLADLDRRGTVAYEVDLRFKDQVIVRPVGDGSTAAAGSRSS